MEANLPSDEEFCRNVISAAAKLGIPCREAGSHFEFLDPLTKVVIPGDANDDKKVALKSACIGLVNYLNANA